MPEDFPDELRPHARIVMLKLREVARHHNAKAVTALAVGNLMAAPQRRHKPWVRSVHDFAAWAADQPTKDVVSRFRRWIDNAPDLAGVESLAADATATASQHVRHSPQDARKAERDELRREEEAALRRIAEQRETGGGDS